MRKTILGIAAAAMLAPLAWAEDLVIIHTNDTHSQLDPTDKGLGGIQRRKVLIDSIKAEHPNVLVADAGDAVQGTLFFTLYGGRAEMEAMNALGYDIAILGNHDFDNGVDSLARNIGLSDARWISTNYDFSQRADLDSLFSPYEIYDIGGKKIAFIGLNLDPKGMIAEGNYDGVRYLDVVKAANSTAWVLKYLKGADLVVALTHLGYAGMPNPSDEDIASASEDIDIILGGHSHTTIVPGTGKEWIKNAAGRPVLVTQNGKSGTKVTEVIIDLDSIGSALPVFRQHTIDSRLDSSTDPAIEALLAPYRKGVDELMGVKIGRTAKALDNNGAALLNFVADFCRDRGSSLVGKPVDLALMNKGSLRRSLPKGTITQGEIISMQPFSNKVLVIEIKGKDLLEAFDVMASRGGDGVSSEVSARFDPSTGRCTSVLIGGKPVDPEATYRVATIDYLANGGDYMEPLTRGKVVASSGDIVYNDLIGYIKSLKNKPINPSDTPRMSPW
ncbi:MAG: bifunctional metallophosphatase/5'-nucleotidase [Muribaculaceae bacterium]|nr:bifunctional metallophosphatase/5'-nucleotidase [Muribaculaceae bacterium]